MQSADTQDSNVLVGAVMTKHDDDSAHTLTADLPPSYTSKSATLPLPGGPEDMALDDDDRDWQSPHADHDEPVHSIEFADDSDDEVPDFNDSPLTHSDLAASGSTHHLPAVTETVIDDDYEMIHESPLMASIHRSRHASPTPPSVHPSRHASPAPSDSSVSRQHTPAPRPHKQPPPPPPRRHHVEEDVPRRHHHLVEHEIPPPSRHHHMEEDIPVPPVPFDPFESLPPPAEMMLMHSEDMDEDDQPTGHADHGDQLYFVDDPATAHPYWPASKSTEL